MTGFLQRIVRSGSRPIPVIGRPRWLPPVIPLEIARASPPASAPPQAGAGAAPARAAFPSEPAPAGQTPPVPALPPRTAAPVRHDLPPQGPRAASSGAADRPSAPLPPREASETFVVPRPPAATRASPTALNLPAAPLVAAIRPPAPEAAPPSPDEVFAAPHRRSADAERSPPGRDQRTPPNAPSGSDLGKELEAVVAWIEAGDRAAAPGDEPRPRAVVRPQADAAAKRAEGTPIAAGPDRPSAARPEPPRAAAAAIEARPVSRSPAMRDDAGRVPSAPPPAARREPPDPRLTVNHLNVQIVNEDRAPRREPQRPAQRVAAPRDSWGAFERRHLRFP